MKRHVFHLAIWSGLGLLLGCNAAPPAEETGASGDPEGVFRGLEDRLVGAQKVLIEFHITAEGAVGADLEGFLEVEAGLTTAVRATGVFAGQEVDLSLSAADGTYEFGNGPGRSAAPTPEHLDEALFIGFTRMGILHNLAMLVGNAPPDRAGGGVRDWVTVDAFAFAEMGGEGEESAVVSFSMTVDGTPVGSASLEIDSEGDPVIRRQAVQFPSGEMRVVERYHTVSIHP